MIKPCGCKSTYKRGTVLCFKHRIISRASTDDRRSKDTKPGWCSAGGFCIEEIGTIHDKEELKLPRYRCPECKRMLKLRTRLSWHSLEVFLVTPPHKVK